MSAAEDDTSDNSDTSHPPDSSKLDDASQNGFGIIYPNMGLRSDFRTWRTQRWAAVERQLQRLTQDIERGCFDEMLSVCASKNSFVAVICTTLSKLKLAEKGFPL
jgi:hypothetical protein